MARRRSSARCPRPSPVQSAASLGAIAEAPAPPAVSGRTAEQAEEVERRYRRNDRARVPRTGVAPFLPLYRRAARHYDVPWRLLAVDPQAGDGVLDR